MSEDRSPLDTIALNNAEFRISALEVKLDAVLNIVDNVNPSAYNPGWWPKCRCDIRKIILGISDGDK